VYRVSLHSIYIVYVHIHMYIHIYIHTYWFIYNKHAQSCTESLSTVSFCISYCRFCAKRRSFDSSLCKCCWIFSNFASACKYLPLGQHYVFRLFTAHLQKSPIFLQKSHVYLFAKEPCISICKRANICHYDNIMCFNCLYWGVRWGATILLQWVAVSCSVLQCVTERCSVLQCVVVCCSVPHSIAVCSSELPFV